MLIMIFSRGTVIPNAARIFQIHQMLRFGGGCYNEGALGIRVRFSDATHPGCHDARRHGAMSFGLCVA